ncbi:hypothetical protein GQ55_2G049500 [Panicum hallii var. hallii]|uniref:Uncharacterized protein n=1 Tax=Panicum hallii var. hallii TaxID=1504633 RepID=A0A2T7ELJ8_9POAL|nr:hypothetical protein GQ55_2G049500 [Panicum hallii var. hallii]
MTPWFRLEICKVPHGLALSPSPLVVSSSEALTRTAAVAAVPPDPTPWPQATHHLPQPLLDSTCRCRSIVSPEALLQHQASGQQPRHRTECRWACGMLSPSSITCPARSPTSPAAANVTHAQLSLEQQDACD